jgi:putative ABC transport system permease protein
MQVSERRREIGLLRAVGATRLDVRLIILGEAGLIGIIGGILGIGVAWLGAIVVDWASATYLPRFPFKPTSYFDFEPWILALGLIFSTVFCVLGGFLPARKASRLQPAQALAQN